MKVERLRPGDWQRLKHIRLRALTDAPDAFGSTLEAESALTDGDWQGRLKEEHFVTFIASVNSDDVGLVVGGSYDDDAGIFAMWVAPDARGKGVGDTLISTVVDWAKKNGQKRVLLDVGDLNEPAIKLYARNGFEPTGQTSTLPPPRSHIKEHRRILWLH